jgi:choline dehydrogenase-like flavoprotein
LLWSVGEAEERTYRRGLAIVLAELEKLEPGLSQEAFDEADPWPDQIVGNWHHEGTTRMNDDPNRGVVDRKCRVHGMSNLFVAGSSVFPVSGSTSPTITILQLALRLGDHLRHELSVVPEVRSG